MPSKHRTSGFNFKHCINWLWWLISVIEAKERRRRCISNPRSSLFLYQVYGQPGIHESLSKTSKQDYIKPWMLEWKWSSIFGNSTDKGERESACWGPWAGHRVKNHTLEGWCVNGWQGAEGCQSTWAQKYRITLTVSKPSMIKWLCCKIPCSSEFAHCLLHPVYPPILFSPFVEHGWQTLLPCSIPSLCSVPALCHTCMIKSGIEVPFVTPPSPHSVHQRVQHRAT